MARNLLLAVASLAMLLTLGVIFPREKAAAQSGTRTTTPPHREKRPYYDTLWTWLQQNRYSRWPSPNETAPQFEKGKSPHGAWIKVYVSQGIPSDPKRLPNGLVVVKENYSPDKKLMAITVMQRSRGYDPLHGDWYYAKYMPDGKIDRTPPEMKSMPVAGRFQMCIDCHSGAGGDDFLFSND